MKNEKRKMIFHKMKFKLNLRKIILVLLDG